MSASAGATDDRREWLKRVLGFDFAASAEPAGLRDRLNLLGLRLRELARTPDAASLSRRFADAVTALKAGDWAATAAALDDIEPRIIGSLSSARGADAAEVVRASRAWRDACTGLTTQLEAFKTAVITALRADDEYGPDELTAIRDEMDRRFDAIGGKLSTGVSDQVDALVNGGPEQRAAAAPRLLDRIGAIAAELRQDTVIPVVEANGMQQMQILAPALQALDQLQSVVIGLAAQ
jgi:hypothetical protein